MSSLVSIIVPNYNVEELLPRCVDSLLNQTYQNLEIILVDDGSPDRCPEICDEYAKKDSRIKVVHKQNGGLSDARNAGYEYVHGEYVAFIDSDDWVAENFVESLYNAIQREGSDIADCNVVKVYSEKDILPLQSDCDIKTYNTQEALSLLIGDRVFKQHVWNKLYKSSIGLSVLFEKGKYHEDEFWTYQVFAKAKKITKIDSVLYYYLQRESSIMGQTYNLKRLDSIDAKTERVKFLIKNFPELTVQAKLNLYHSCLYIYQMSLKHMNKEDKIKAKQKLKEIISEYPLKKSEIATLDKKQQIWYKLPLGLSATIRNLIDIGR
ncbi:MAG: glycosyltransferase [Bacillota bacterium]|nr:glycosyltransferase [Bacillota bacterium]